MRLDQIADSEDKLASLLSSIKEYTDRAQSKSELRIREARSKVELLLCNLIQELDDEREKINKHLEKIESTVSKLEANLDAYKNTLEKESRAETKKLKDRVEELESYIDSLEIIEADGEEEKDEAHYYRAKTLAFLEKVILLISKWSNTEENSLDFENVSKAVLIPSVYLKVAKYDYKYLLRELPPNLDKIIVDGRGHIAQLREAYSKVSLDSKSIWEETTFHVKAWWIDEALPKIFGFIDLKWEGDPIMDWDSYRKWDKDEMAQVRMYPPIYDTIYSQGVYSDLTEDLTTLSLELEDPKYKF